MSRIRNIFALLRGQLWIIPTLTTALAGLLAYLLLRQESHAILPDENDLWWVYSGDADSARNLLSSFLSGLMTMTSLVVSVTFVILTLAANQLGPRLISTFMGDRQIQLVLGLFLGTIFYVIVVLRTLGTTIGAGGVPHIAVTAASALTIGCLFALLFYLHKIARSIIADNAVEAVSQSLRRDLREMLPENGAREPVPTRIERRHSRSVSLGCCGYIQVVDYGKLVAIACREDAVIEAKVRAGHFVLAGGDHIRIHADEPIERHDAEAIRGAFIIGSERTPAQDLEHGIRQLVEIALRALSPGVNDPFTAIAVVDRVGAALEQIFLRSLQPRVLRDEAGEVRVVANRTDAAGLVEAAFNAVRQSGAENPAILIRIADILGQLAPVLTRDEPRGAVLAQLAKLEQTARLAHLAEDDRKDVLDRINQARAVVAEARPRD